MEQHHITEDMVKNSPCFAEEWPYISSKIAGRDLIAYNAPFDSGRLRHTAIAHNVELPNLRWYCLMRAYANFYGMPGKHGPAEFQKLKNACAQQGIPIEQKHRAQADVLDTAALIRRLAELGDKAVTHPRR